MSLRVAVLLTISLLVAPALFPVAEAQVTYLWTTTADFDGGNTGTTSTPGGWANRTSYPTDFAPTMVPYGSYLYAAGGFDNWVWTDAFRRYDPATDTWSLLDAMSASRSDMASVVWADRLYFLSGSTGSGCCTITNLNTVEYYNVTSAAWTTVVSSNPFYGEGFMAVYRTGSIYFTNGTQNVRRYWPANNSWQDLGCTINSGTGAANGIIGDYWYFAGGGEGDSNVRRFSLLAHTCDNAFDTMPFSGRAQGPWNNVVLNGKLYLMNGIDTVGGGSGLFYRDVWEYNTTDWRQMSSSNVKRTNHGGAVLGGFLYIIGGVSEQDNLQGIPTMERFDPSGSTVDGHNETETTTTSRLVANGNLMLSSCMADSFYRNDYIGDPLCWSEVDRENHGSCTYTVSDVGLTVTQPTVFASAAGPHCALVSRWNWTDDFDMRVRQNMTTTGNGLEQFHILNERVPRWNENPTVDGTLIQITVSGGSRNYEVFTVSDGGASACGVNPTTLAAGARYIRVTQIGTTETFYHNTDGSESWTQFRQCTNNAVGPWYFVGTSSSGTTGITTVVYDDFYLADGTPDDGAYRSSGDWTSSTVALDNQRITSLTLNHSSLTSENVIDRVEILDDGSVVWSSDTDITSGSQTTYAPDEDVDGAITIRITLRGNGTASPTLEAAAFTTEDTPVDVPTDFEIVLFFAILVFLFAAGIVHPIFWFLDAFVSFLLGQSFTLRFPLEPWGLVFLSFGMLLVVVAIGRIVSERRGR